MLSRLNDLRLIAADINDATSGTNLSWFLITHDLPYFPGISTYGSSAARHIIEVELQFMKGEDHMPQEILLPLDLEEVSQSAIPLARTIAREHNIPITAFSVVEMPPDLASFLGGRSGIDALIEMKGQRKHELERALRQIAEVPVRVVIAHGAIAEEIVLQADRMRDPLIVMASHSRGRFHDLAISSIRARVVQAASCPVLVCRLDEPDRPERIPTQVRRVLIPLDGSAFSARALAIARRVFNSPLVEFRLVGAADPVLYPAGIQSSPTSELVQSYYQNAQMEAEHYLETCMDELTDAGVQADWKVIQGSASEVIAREAEEWGADIIAIATHGRTGVQRFLMGSVALSILNSASIPVLMVGPKDWD